MYLKGCLYQDLLVYLHTKINYKGPPLVEGRSEPEGHVPEACGQGGQLFSSASALLCDFQVHLEEAVLVLAIV